MTKTEALKQALNSLCDIDNMLFADGKRTPAYVEQAIAAIDKALAEPEPDADWQLVPKEPTESMLMAYATAWYDRQIKGLDVGSIGAHEWRMMLAAAPSKAPQ